MKIASGRRSRHRGRRRSRAAVASRHRPAGRMPAQPCRGSRRAARALSGRGLPHHPCSVPAPPAMETAALTFSLAELRTRLPGLMLRDQHRLGRRVDKAAALRDAGAREQALGQVVAELDAAAARAEARRLAVPGISYPSEPPVRHLKDEIAEVIRNHQVVIIAGETGSGKTTQLPKASAVPVRSE